MKNKKGFTLVEILAVIVIIAILSGLVIIAVNRYIKKGKDNFNKSVENTLVSNAKNYYSENLSELPNGKIEDGSARYIDVLWASELLSQGYYTNDIVDADENNCRTSYVVVENNGSNNYEYTPCVVCENGYVSDKEICNFIQSNDTTNPGCEVKPISTVSANGKRFTNYNINGDRIQLSLTGTDSSGIAGFEVNGVFIAADNNGKATRYVETAMTTGNKINVYDKNNNKGTCALSEPIYIDKTIPSVTLKATKKISDLLIVSSDEWSTQGLNFTFRQTNTNASGATIRYCKDTTNTCTPSLRATSGTKITTYNTEAGIYYIRYNIVSGVGKKSETYSYTAKVAETVLTVAKVGKDEIKEIDFTTFDTNLDIMCYSEDESIVKCEVDDNKNVIVTGVTGGETYISIKEDDAVLQKTQVLVYEAPTVPTITASDGIASGKWHTSDVTLNFGGSEINGPGGIAYYYGTNEIDFVQGSSSDSITSDVDGELYFAKACNSDYPSVCSNVSQYILKLDGTAPTLTFTRVNTNRVDIICKDSTSGIYYTKVWWVKPGTSSWSYEYGSDWSGYSKKYTSETVYFKTVSIGTHEIEAKCKDLAGNSTTKTDRYYVGSSGSGSTSSSSGSASISGTCSCYDRTAPQVYHYICDFNDLKNNSQCSSFCSARGLAYYGSTCAYQ